VQRFVQRTMWAICPFYCFYKKHSVHGIIFAACCPLHAESMRVGEIEKVVGQQWHSGQWSVVSVKWQLDLTTNDQLQIDVSAKFAISSDFHRKLRRHAIATHQLFSPVRAILRTPDTSQTAANNVVRQFHDVLATITPTGWCRKPTAFNFTACTSYCTNLSSFRIPMIVQGCPFP